MRATLEVRLGVARKLGFKSTVIGSTSTALNAGEVQKVIVRIRPGALYKLRLAPSYISFGIHSEATAVSLVR